ncbi:MAG: uL22 family ribosomal protein [Patescibacteria group bacterium]|nr:uL22 family ribosomal protein [Patescibacteria group bacterium]
MNESTTYLKNLIISPKKLRFYLKAIKKLSPKEALDYLFYGKQKATKILYQAIKSAIANAKQTLKIDENLLKFKVLAVDEGIKLKRYRPGSRGTVKPILKRRSHIKIVLTKDLIKKTDFNSKKSMKRNLLVEKKQENKKRK